MNFGTCQKETDDKKIKIEDRKSGSQSIAYIENKNQEKCFKIQVDGCLSFEGKKCDWLIIPSLRYIGIFIELKGKNISEAFEQLKNTINTIEDVTKRYINKKFDKKYCYIIARNCPLDKTKIQNEKYKFKENFKADLKIERSGHKIDLNKIK